MAPGIIHEMDAKLLGYDHRINMFMDFPSRSWWLGPRHRILFHRPDDAMFIGFAFDGLRGAMGGLRHLYLDGIWDYEVQAAQNMLMRVYIDSYILELFVQIEAQKLKQREQ